MLQNFFWRRSGLANSQDQGVNVYMKCFRFCWKLLGCAVLFTTATAPAAEIRIGIIGCDTSHVTAFTENLNNPAAKDHVLGGRVVAAFEGGSKDIPSSANRVEQYTKTLKEKYGVQFYDSIEEMCRNVDAVLLESLDGRPHLEQAKAVFRSRARVLPGQGDRVLPRTLDQHGPRAMFIDKPMAASAADVKEIFRLAQQTRMPIFSASALRFAKDTQAVAHGSIGKVTYAETYGPCELEPHHPDLFWYGVHGVEALFTVMGPGCETVQRGKTAEGKIEVTGLWPGGRKGIFREDHAFHGLAKGDKGEASAGSFDGYVPLVAAIMKFFETGVAPVTPEETIEIFEFMEAADRSKAADGAVVKLRP
jgi:hypothetical protein